MGILARGWQPPRSTLLDREGPATPYTLPQFDAPGVGSVPLVVAVKLPGGAWCMVPAPNLLAVDVRAALAAKLRVPVDHLADYSLLLRGVGACADSLELWDESRPLPATFLETSRRHATLELRRLRAPAHVPMPAPRPTHAQLNWRGGGISGAA